MLISWLLLKVQVHHLLKVDLELLREAMTKELRCRAHFFLHNELVFLMLGLCLGPLPGELPTDQVDKNITDGLHVISS